MPEDGPYETFRAQRADGLARLQWGILDHHYVPAEPVKDWRRKHRTTWYGTQEEAEELCRLLNQDRKILGKPVKTEFDLTSSTQKIWRMNQAKRRSVSRSGSTSSAASRSSSTSKTSRTKSNRIVMQSCTECGRMYTGEHEC